MGDLKRRLAVTLGVTILVLTSDIDRIGPLTLANQRTPSLQNSPVADGVVERYLIDPRGEVEGLLLTDGSQMHVTSRIAHDLVKAIRPGDHVRVYGIRKKGKAVVQPESIVNVTAGISFSIPLRLDLPLPPHEEYLTMTPMRAEGSIQILLYGRKGEVHGMVLSDGTQVRLPLDVGDEFRRSLRVGESVKVEGYGNENQYGRSMEALAMSARGSTLTPLDATTRHHP
jgi:hypothetical protein